MIDQHKQIKLKKSKRKIIKIGIARSHTVPVHEVDYQLKIWTANAMRGDEWMSPPKICYVLPDQVLSKALGSAEAQDYDFLWLFTGADREFILDEASDLIFEASLTGKRVTVFP